MRRYLGTHARAAGGGGAAAPSPTPSLDPSAYTYPARAPPSASAAARLTPGSGVWPQPGSSPTWSSGFLDPLPRQSPALHAFWQAQPGGAQRRGAHAEGGPPASAAGGQAAGLAGYSGWVPQLSGGPAAGAGELAGARMRQHALSQQSFQYPSPLPAEQPAAYNPL